MSLSFKYIPLTFLSDEDEIKKQIRNTIILRYFFDKNNSTVSLSELIEGTQYGYNASALESGRNKFLRISDITNGKVDWETVPYCNCDDEETYLLYPEDILIARTGGTTGKSFLISSPPEHSIYAGYLIRIRANGESLPEFLKLFLDSYAYWSQIVLLNEDEFRPSVNANKLKELILPECDIIQQEVAFKISIGEQIGGYEDLILQIEQALKEYETCKGIQEHCEIQKTNAELLKQSTLQEAIQGKLTEEWRKQNPDIEPASELLKRIKAEKAQLIKEKKIKKEKPLSPITEDEIPYELPEGWAWCRLGEVFETSSGGTPSRSNPRYWNGTITWYKSGELNDGLLSVSSQEKITESGLNESSATLFPRGTLLIAMYGATAGKLSTLGREASTNQAICGFYKNQFIESEYLFSFLMANRPKMISESWGMSQPNISQTYLKKFIFALPPFEEQRAIVQKVVSLMEKSRELEAEITQGVQHAQILMQAVLKEAFASKKEPLELS